MVIPMAQSSNQKPSNNDNDQRVESPQPAEEGTNNEKGLSRRDALGLLAKHAVYTTPAVLAYLSLKSRSARAGSTGQLTL